VLAPVLEEVTGHQGIMFLFGHNINHGDVVNSWSPW